MRLRPGRCMPTSLPSVLRAVGARPRPPMRPRRTPLWCALLVSAAACATASPPPGEPELKDLSVAGNHALSDNDVTDKIATTADSWIPFTEAKYLDRAVLQTDLKRIQRLYEANGYFDGHVTGVDITPVHGNNKLVSVTIHVDEGQPTHVSDLKLEGIDALPEEVKKELQSDVRAVQVGKVFLEDQYDAAKAGLGLSLRNAGYAEAQVQGQVVVDPVAHTAAITFALQPGERYSIGRIVVSGTSRVPRKKVAQEVADAAPPGTLYSDKKIQDAQNRVFDMNVFSLAKVTRAAPDPQTHTLPLAVDVREAPFRTLRAGGGFGIERFRQEVRGQGEYVNRNFFGGLRKLDFDNRLAYVVTPNVLDYFRGQGAGGVAGYSKLTFTQPDLFLNDLDLNVTGQLQRDIQVGYTYNSALTGVGFEKRWGRKLDALLQYNFQVIQLNSAVDPRQLTSSRAPQLATNCQEQSCFLILEFLEQRLELDLRDSAILTHQGIYAAVDVQEGGGPGASFQYLRLEPEVRGYLPLGKRLVLAQRFQWGWMKGFGTDKSGATLPTPITQRFFGGGANSVRAYGSRLMSPVAVVCRDTTGKQCSQAGDFQAIPVGGDGLYESSTELRFDITHVFGVVGFVDVGAVPIAPLTVRKEDIAVAPGVGFRYYTLFGPVRLDFAYRLPGFSGNDGLYRLAPSQVVINYPPPSGTSFVSPGPTGRFDFQFSIGEAF